MKVGRNQPAIRAEGLTKYFGAVVAVEDLSFEVGRGEVYGFLGANGAGKTTSMRLLLDLLRPSKGSAALLGVDCHRRSLAARALVGYLPGELPTYPDLTAGGYLDYLRRIDTRPVQPAYLSDLLARFDVSDLDLGRRLRDQSHGMKQKIGIVAALMTQAPVLILDEPTAGLDPLMVQAFRDTLAALAARGDTTVLLSSHVLADVEASCGRIGFIRGGRMVAVESIANLKRSVSRRVTVTFAAAVPGRQLPPLADVIVRQCTDREWVLDVGGPLGPVLQALAPLPIHDLQIEPFRLERHVARLYGVELPS